jgi:hypothetical protein
MIGLEASKRQVNLPCLTQVFSEESLRSSTSEGVSHWAVAGKSTWKPSSSMLTRCTSVGSSLSASSYSSGSTIKSRPRLPLTFLGKHQTALTLRRPNKHSWFVIHFIIVILEILFSFTLHKKVRKSYIKTYRWLKKNQNREYGMFRTALEVLAPSKRSLRLGIVLVDLLYCSFGIYGLWIYCANINLIKSVFQPAILISVVLPLLSSLATLTSVRAVASIFVFIIVPWWSVRDQRKIFMRLGGGLYENAKFPLLTYKEYIL